MLINNIIEDFKDLTKVPTNFLSTDKELSENLKLKLKQLYDFNKEEEIKLHPLNTLKTLVIKNFDIEQIWQQLEIQNEALIDFVVPEISKLISIKSRLKFKELDTNEDEIDSDFESGENEEEMEKDEENEKSKLSSDDDSMNESNDDDQSDEEPDFKKKKSVVDDKFFKLNEMEEFLNDQEKDDGAEDDDSDDELKHTDFFKNDDDDDDNEEVDENAVDPRVAKFKDFFRKNDKSQNERKRKIEENDSENEEFDATENIKSNLDLRQDRLKKKIKTIEEQAVAEKPWQLKGEITADQRPKDSLLEEVVDFDITTRPAPIVTEEVSLQLEDIIKQRIKNKVFNSVERKIKPVDTPLEFKKKLVLDQEKSKLSLAQIYEKEYQDKQAKLDPEYEEHAEEEEPLKKEIKQLTKDLFRKLDALSNYHYTSTPLVPDIKIVNNLPSISMEEVAPVGVSNATLLAPEEVKRKLKGDVIGKSERTKTDKKRERRKKKILQKKHKKIIEQKEAKRKLSKQSRKEKAE